MALARTHAGPPAHAHGTIDLVAALAAIALGLGIAYVDSRPYWDDTGVTTFALFTFAGFLGFLVPHRVWLMALGIGIWIPALAFVQSPRVESAPMLLVLAFAFVGAYGGQYLRTIMDAGQDEDAR
ncbi:MAG TPA: hypothetical protein VM032_01100 [Vicinamibacterales bacterium]|nr:hypothetical protein [Vicinamibacterales bacterium]